MDTRGLAQRKIHPKRDSEYLRWLSMKPCAVRGMIDTATGQPHICWHPQALGYVFRDGVREVRFASDPAHTTKTGRGIKGPDNLCIPLCRHSHRQQEGATAAFERRYGIDCAEIAARLYGEYLHEMEKKS